jgi:hypothetical protein
MADFTGSLSSAEYQAIASTGILGIIDTENITEEKLRALEEIAEEFIEEEAEDVYDEETANFIAEEAAEELELQQLVRFVDSLPKRSRQAIDFLPSVRRYNTQTVEEQMVDILDFPLVNMEDRALFQQIVDSMSSLRYEVDNNNNLVMNIQEFIRGVVSDGLVLEKELIAKIWASYLERKFNRRFLFVGKDFEQRMYDLLMNTSWDEGVEDVEYILNQRSISVLLPKGFRLNEITRDLVAYMDLMEIVRLFNLNKVIGGRDLITQILILEEEWAEIMEDIRSNNIDSILEWVDEQDNLRYRVIDLVRQNYKAVNGVELDDEELREEIRKQLERDRLVETVLSTLRMRHFYSEEELEELRQTRRDTFAQVQQDIEDNGIDIIKQWINSEELEEYQQFIVDEIARINLIIDNLASEGAITNRGLFNILE